MDRDHSGTRVFWLLAGLACLIVLVLILAPRGKADGAERAAFGAMPDAAYNQSYVGLVLALGGEVKGTGRGDLAASGGNAYCRWLDIATANSKGNKGVRAYYSDKLLRKGAMVVAEGKITTKGRMELTRITFIVNDPAK
jgi:hypothetical protein